MKTYTQPYSGIVFTIGEAPSDYNIIVKKRVLDDAIIITVTDYQKGIHLWEVLPSHDDDYNDYEPCNIAASLLDRLGIILDRDVKWEFYGLKSNVTVFIS